MGEVAIAAHPVSTNQGFKTFVLGNGLTSDFVYYYLQHAKKLAEQTLIEAEVERRLSVVEELEAVVAANLQRSTGLRQSILQRAFSGGLG